jgi:uncharacterized protein
MPLPALLLSCLLWLPALLLAADGDVQPVPALTAPVTDLADLLPAPDEARLNARLSAFAQEKGSQVAVLIVATTQPEDIFSYSFRVAEAWQLGRKGIDDGVLLVVAAQDRKTHLQVGYGLEGAIPDARAKQILQDIIRPHFKTRDFSGGVIAGAEAVITLINGEALPAPSRQDRSESRQNPMVIAIFIGIIAGFFLRAIFGRLIGGLSGGGIALTLALILGTALGAALFGRPDCPAVRHDGWQWPALWCRRLRRRHGQWWFRRRQLWRQRWIFWGRRWFWGRRRLWRLVECPAT